MYARSTQSALEANMKARKVIGRGKGKKLSTDAAFGLWKDRKDLRDVHGFVRLLRKSRSDQK